MNEAQKLQNPGAPTNAAAPGQKLSYALAFALVDRPFRPIRAGASVRWKYRGQGTICIRIRLIQE